MKDKKYYLKKIQECGVVAVIRGKTADNAVKTAEACIKGNVTIIELTYSTPDVLEAIKATAEKYRDNPSVVVGAGTVMTRIDAERAIKAGAKFIVAPYFDEETVKYCANEGILSMPGIFTPTEAVHAMRAGADILKVFPGDVAGPEFIKSFHGPVPDALMMPSGGVDEGNIKDWIKAGACAVGAGSSLTKGAKTDDFELVTETARRFIKRMSEARNG